MKKTIAVFIGSIREERKGDLVSSYIQTELEKRGFTVHIIDPKKYVFLQTLIQPYHHQDNPNIEFEKVHTLLEESDGFILLTPEYNHGYSGTIKNALDNFYDEYAQKPFGIISYSVSRLGGVRANQALRLVIGELGGVAIPSSLVFGSVSKVFDSGNNLVDDYLQKETTEFLDEFEWYVNALSVARLQG